MLNLQNMRNANDYNPIGDVNGDVLTINPANHEWRVRKFSTPFDERKTIKASFEA